MPVGPGKQNVRLAAADGIQIMESDRPDTGIGGIGQAAQRAVRCELGDIRSAGSETLG